MLLKKTNILVKAQKGHLKSQMSLYDQNYKAVFNSCYRVLLNKEDAEDVTHDTFISVFEAKPSEQNIDNTMAWLRRIGINKSLDYLRRQEKFEFTNEIEDIIEQKEINNGKNESENEYLNLEPEKIYKGIHQMPKQYRLVLNLYLIEGFDHSEISQILNINTSTSRSQLTRAKRKLKAYLNNEEINIRY